jgi:4'-phosphopantetheinyl transferase
LISTPEIQLPEGEVHIWIEKLSLEPELVAEGKKTLSLAETTRADRFHQRRDHDRYVLAHARLRQILSRYTAVDAAKLEFEVSEFGKPSLAQTTNAQQINFNVSHSGDWIMLGVVRNARIGVDIEEVKPESATTEVAERFFTKREIAELRALPPDQRVIGFFNCWTRKEAYLKALGCGLSADPRDFEVTVLPGVLPGIRQRLQKDAADWGLFDLSKTGYVASLATNQKLVTVKRKSG